mmetsp:Transcript_4046/g.9190  ORF Transcript_4046/g.9190 Transcript_4046/m.9190 type:complete len:345 (+) Transcript_4046:63-1097(+)|eukprot:CAMPEP_0178703148 /NCGR_PEP_ID=MMETSP0699-20121125/13338_1 /TAXON_ID=265572 /ORGANISM="Extubocellulus spinifer, Strain CCMP396" /LENGTH=344 /DNA_ID=CAMNT_0020350101 /DNA_START=1436 /DNA_END=2470 /DNA_ORIENTATION=-
MADFNTDGFSAVASFFRDDAAAEETNSKQQPNNSSSSVVPVAQSAGRKHSRLGLGATAGSTSSSKQSQFGKASASKDIGRKILGIGRSRKGQSGDDDFDYEREYDDNRNDDDEGDDEEGRTSAVRAKAKRTFDAASLITDAQKPANKKKKKKKAGKKERATAAEAKVAGGSGREDQDQQEEEDIAKRNEAEPSQPQGDGKDGDDHKGNKTKRKRKKVRSRQKNIRKDNRPARLKPSHLVLGNSHYHGRALTPETRTAMSLPESKTRQKAKRLLREGGDGGANDGDGGAGAASSRGEIGLGLAVDDMLDDLGVAADGNGAAGTVKSKNGKKVKKKKKKSKFKNLK